MLTSDPSFVPPRCPFRDCRHHLDPSGWRHAPHGTFLRQAAPHVIRRFLCLSCERTFSTQTFDTTYWLKKPELQEPIFVGLVACSGFRQLGRSLGVAGTTVQRQAARLGRHCLLFNALRRPSAAPAEDLVLDGLVSFEYSQYWPFETNVLVGADSSFVYGFTDSELRRSGRMRPQQKLKRALLEKRHGKPDPQATRKSVAALIRLVAPQSASLRIRSDEHAAYPRAFRDVAHAIEHATVSSRRCRTARNPLFVVDHLDLMVRHGSANHKRETIAFSKRRQSAMERMALLVAWWNHVKRRVEARLNSPTPAMSLGLDAAPLSVADILHRRLFPSLIPLPEPHRAYYWRDVETRQVPRGTRHELIYAA